MKKFKKIISLFCALVMLIACISVSSFASAKDFNENDVVGKVALAVIDRHSFIIFCNTSGKSIDVSNHINNFCMIYDSHSGEYLRDFETGKNNEISYTVLPGELITIELSAEDLELDGVSKNGGSYFNYGFNNLLSELCIDEIKNDLELYIAEGLNVVVKNATYSQLISILDYFNNNSYFSFMDHNCTTAAAGAWKEAFGVDLNVTPNKNFIKTNLSKFVFSLFVIEILDYIDGKSLAKSFYTFSTYMFFPIVSIIVLVKADDIKAFPLKMLDSMKNVYGEEVKSFSGIDGIEEFYNYIGYSQQ